MEGTTIAGTLLRGGRAMAGAVTIEGEQIVDVGLGRVDEADLRHRGFIAPGLCDLQVNGAAGYEVTNGPEALDQIEARLLDAGVTAYLPTIITGPPDLREKALELLGPRVEDPRFPAAGVHLEGPLLSPEFARVHDVDWLEDASEGLPEGYEDPAIRLVTLAPELAGGRGAVRSLAARGVTVSLGHSGATAEQAEAAVDAGASAVTHLFNAMGPLHHRAPGLVGHALIDPRVALMLIADGLHVDGAVLELVRAAAGKRVVLVSDATSPAGAPEGVYRLAGKRIARRGDLVVDEEGRLSGSALLLDRCVRSYWEATRCTLAEAWVAGSERPAELVGIPTGLAPGCPANIVLLDRDLGVQRVMFRGEWVRG